MTAGGPPLPPPQAPGPWDSGQQYAPPPPVYPVYPVYQGVPQYQNLYPGPAPGIGYAGFWIRVLASIIDSIIIFLPAVIVFFIVEGQVISNYGDCVSTATANGTLISQCINTLFSSFGVWELAGIAI